MYAEYSYRFQSNLPSDFFGPSISIDNDSRGYEVFLVESIFEAVITVYSFRCNVSGLSFQDAARCVDLLAVGFQERLILFNCKERHNVLTMQLDGYFGSLRWVGEFLYVADAGNVMRFDGDGKLLWHADNLGIDGVVMSSIENGRLTGAGEWDPPGGWRDFVVDLESGRLLTEDGG